MKSLLTHIKHAKITTREVFIHLRKNGDLKRKSYSKYLKMQYRLAGEACTSLQSTGAIFEDHQETPYNTPHEKKLTMPLHLVKSELSTMSKSFEDISFLTEAWHFFQKEMMKPSRFTAFKPVSEFTEVKGFTASNSTESTIEPILNTQDINLEFSYKNLVQTTAQSQLTLTPASGFDRLNQLKNPQINSPLCIQVIKWAQEGKLNLN